MKKFLQKTLLYSLLVLGLNIPFGQYLATYETVDLQQLGAFFPASRWNDYYSLEDNIDVLFLGSSHAYRSYDPRIIGNALDGKTVFNFGSSGQTPLTGYHILEEILRDHRPEVIVLDVFVMVFSEDTQAVNARINWSAMRPGEGRKKLFKEGFSWSQKLTMTLFPTYLHRAYLKRKIQVLLGRKHTGQREEIYQGNGFVITTDTISMEALRVVNEANIPTESLDFISDESKVYFEKIRDRCTEAGIPLVMMVSPIPLMTAEKIGIFDESKQYFSKFSEAWGVPYHDFIEDRLPTIKDDEHYYDDHHMNAAGARIYSNEVARILKAYLQ